MEDAVDIHVGDVGTIYQVPVYDHDLVLANFDPSGGSVLRIDFSMPTADGSRATVRRTATPVQVSIRGVLIWCLTYTVVPGDLTTGFHAATGLVSMQGYIEMADGRKWRSQEITRDYLGRLMQVVANLPDPA